MTDLYSDGFIDGYKAGSSDWIKPSDRLPDTERKVLCTTLTKSGNKNIVIGYYSGRWCCGMNSNVIAWMELPEPYEEEEDA